MIFQKGFLTKQIFRIPDWASEIFDELTKLSAFEGYTFIGTREMSRLYSGFLLREIADRFTLKIDDVLKPNRTLWIYSAHDETITGFLNLLGLFDVSKTLSNYILVKD